MTQGRTTAMALLGFGMLVYAAGLILGMNPPVVGEGGRVSLVTFADIAPFVAGLVTASAVQLWAAFSETPLTKPVAHVVAIAGMAAGIVLTALLEPVGVALFVVYAYILIGLITRADETRTDNLRKHLHRGKASDPG